MGKRSRRIKARRQQFNAPTWADDRPITFFNDMHALAQGKRLHEEFNAPINNTLEWGNNMSSSDGTVSGMLGADNAPRIDDLITTLMNLPAETPVVIAMVNDNQPFSPKPKAIGLSRSTQDIVHMGSHMFDDVLDNSPVEHYVPVRRMRKTGEGGYLLSTMTIGKYKDTADNFPCNLVDNMNDPWYPTTTAQFAERLMEVAWYGNDNVYVSTNTVTEDNGLMVGTDPAIVVGVLVSRQTGIHDVACVIADTEPSSTAFFLQHNPVPDHVIILCSLGGWMPMSFKTAAAPPKILERSMSRAKLFEHSHDRDSLGNNTSSSDGAEAN